MSAPYGMNAYLHRGSRGHSRELVLVICFLSLIGLFAVTAFASRMYHKRVHTLADQWFAQGETDFQAGDVKKALVDYRNALAFSPTNRTFQFHLARALAADGDYPGARAYLSTLLSESPGSGEINLELARVAAKQSKTEEAMLYYNAAIYGGWNDQPIERRWDARRELCEYLLSKGTSSQAEPALVALADNTPEGDIEKEKTVGRLLLQGQMWNRALEQFRAVLAGGANDSDALEGAGIAAFNLGQYARAIGYFDRLPKEMLADPQVSSMLQTAHLVESANPLLPGLSTGERASRASKALAAAEARAQACIAKTTPAGSTAPPHLKLSTLLASAQQQSKDWTERNFNRFPDRVNPAMNLVFQIEEEAAKTCEAPEREDRALLLIDQAKQAGGAQL